MQALFSHCDRLLGAIREPEQEMSGPRVCECYAVVKWEYDPASA
jgi:hypothetical protein